MSMHSNRYAIAVPRHGEKRNSTIRKGLLGTEPASLDGLEHRDEAFLGILRGHRGELCNKDVGCALQDHACRLHPPDTLIRIEGGMQKTNRVTVRLAAAQFIIDRAYGKPVTPSSTVDQRRGQFSSPAT